MRPRFAGEGVKPQFAGGASANDFGGDILGRERYMWRSTQGDIGAGNACASSHLLHKARSTGKLGATGREHPDLKTGTQVRIAGLSGRAELNNTRAEVVDDVPDNAGRVYVRLTEAAST